MRKPSDASSSSCLGRLAMTSASGVDAGRPAAFAHRSVHVDLAAHELGRPPVERGQIMQVVDPVRLVQRAGARRRHPRSGSGRPPPRAGRRTTPATGTCRTGRTRSARPTTRRGSSPEVLGAAAWTAEPVGELEVVAAHGAHAAATGASARYSGGSRQGSSRSCQTITPSEPQTPATLRSRRGDTGRSRAGRGSAPAAAGRRRASGRRARHRPRRHRRTAPSTSDTRAVPVPAFRTRVEHLVGLDLDRQVALAAGGTSRSGSPTRCASWSTGSRPPAMTRAPAFTACMVCHSRASGSSASMTTAPSTPSNRAAKVSPS